VRGSFDLDPAQCEYGAATPAVRRILSEWVAVDWFEPPGDDGAAARATRLFEEHNARARACSPELFPAHLEMRLVGGDWAAFAALCGRVRAPAASWDWKFGALKRLSSDHSKRHGLRLCDLARVNVESGGQPGPGDLFFCIGDLVIRNAIGPRLDLGVALSPEHVEVAQWYMSYAQMDVLEAIEWQLAENSDRLDGNPFAPLIRCYDAGFYPFSLGSAEVALFALQR
jgi:hypothetical protein